MRIAIVTINYNSEKVTHDCLRSLKKLALNGNTLQIIVVDNASRLPFVLTDDEKEQHITLIRSEKNLGFTGGNNIAIKYALSLDVDYIMLLNNDTLVDSHLLGNMLEVFNNHRHVGAVVPKIYFAKGREYHKASYAEKDLGHVFWYAGGFVDWNNIFTRHRGVDEVDKGQYDTEDSITFATGCCVLIPSDVLRKVGLFDNKYFLYFEDGDLSQRILRKGYTIIYSPKGVVWHVNAASGGGSGSILHDYYLTRNRLLFGMKFAPIRSKIALIRESIRLLFQGREWQKRGVCDFYLQRFGKGSYK